MAIQAYPVGGDSGFSEQSQINSDYDRLIAGLGRIKDIVVDPANGDLDLTTSGSSLDATIATGYAFLNGHLVHVDASKTLTLDASATNEIFVTVDDALADNADIEYTSDGSTPSRTYTMKIWEATTDSSGVTGTTEYRPWAPYPGDTVANTINGEQFGVSNAGAVNSTGTYTISVTFPRAYISTVHDVQITLRELTDTSVDLRFWRIDPSTIDTSGFTIEYGVGGGGSSGSTVKFGWVARGY